MGMTNNSDRESNGKKNDDSKEAYDYEEGFDWIDMVYFFTDYISHVSYNKFIAAVREKKIPFGYIGSVNIDSVINQVYKDLSEA